MRFAAAAASWVLLHSRSAESSGQPWLGWGVPAPLGQPNPMAGAPVPQQPVPPQWWPQMGQQMPQAHQPAPAPAQMPLDQPKLGQKRVELNQQRATLPVAGRIDNVQTSSTLMPSTASVGSWNTSNTGKAVHDLLDHVNRLFQRPAGVTGGSAEVVFCVENITNVLAQLSNLIQSVIAFCEAENMQKGFPGGYGQVAQQMRLNYSSTRNFPVDQFITQGHEYARRVTSQMTAVRELLGVVVAPGVTKEMVAREVQRFNQATVDAKEVFQLGSQVSNAAVGAVLPYLSTCSFFPKNDHQGNYKLWSLVGARINSTLRYLYQVLEAVRSASGKMEDLVGGKIKPQSLVDFARSRPLFRAAAHLETAEARSVSAVRYFNDLAAAYNNHQQSLTAPPAPEQNDFRPATPLMEEDQQTIDEADMMGNISLMAEDLEQE